MEDFSAIRELVEEAMDQYRHQGSSDTQTTLLTLPNEVLERILGFLSYDQIAKTRIICHRFNNVCQRLLNQGFISAKIYLRRCQDKAGHDTGNAYAISVKFPREEYETRMFVAFTRNILYKIDVTCLLLDLTYLVSIKSNGCCFIPGKVLDEIYRLLFKIDTNYEIFMNRSRDKSSLGHMFDTITLMNTSLMAIYHFIREILPKCKSSWTLPTVDSGFGEFMKRKIIPFFTGNFTTNHIDNINKLISRDRVGRETLLRALGEKLQNTRIKDENQPNGIERGLAPEKIIWETSILEESESFFLIKWKDIREADFISESSFGEKFPTFLSHEEKSTREFVKLIGTYSFFINK